MSQIIVEMGSGNTCKNDENIIRKMIFELDKIDTRKHDVVIKWQLFEKAGDNIPLKYKRFEFAYDYARCYGYATTASVFDIPSLKFLLGYPVPFIKIANRRDLDWLIGEVPRKIPVYVSYTSDVAMQYNFRVLACISEYPASIEQYEKIFSSPDYYFDGISDHTIGLDLFKKYQPAIWEKHYKLPDSTGLDAGPFAITPGELAEIL